MGLSEGETLPLVPLPAEPHYPVGHKQDTAEQNGSPNHMHCPTQVEHTAVMEPDDDTCTVLVLLTQFFLGKKK